MIHPERNFAEKNKNILQDSIKYSIFANQKKKIMSDNKFKCELFKLEHITTLSEVRRYASYLGVDLKVSFYPKDKFESYVDDKGEPIFTPEEALIGNRLMAECFDVCEEEGKELYEEMEASCLEELFKRVREKRISRDEFMERFKYIGEFIYRRSRSMVN